MKRLDAVLAALGEQADLAERRLDRAEQVARRTDELRVTGRAAGGRVQVVVDGVGQLVDLTVTGGPGDLSGAVLRAAVLEAHAGARRSLAAEVARIVEEVYGDDAACASGLVESYRERFGAEVLA